jgi:hypothetical protein
LLVETTLASLTKSRVVPSNCPPAMVVAAFLDHWPTGP